MTTAPQTQLDGLAPGQPSAVSVRVSSKRFALLFYGSLLAISISLWFLAIRAPLWLDETGSWYQIREGFWKIPVRQGGLSFPAYSYILWFFSKILGTSEVALRVPSVLAMLGAAYLLYRAASEVFGREIGLVTAVLFCAHPIVVFASIDVRPYAFAVLTVNASLYLLVRLRADSPACMAACLGLSAALIVYFHFLFAVILPFLLVCCLWRVRVDRVITWKQVGVALATLGLALLPVIPGLLYTVRTRDTHVCEDPPAFNQLTSTLAPGLTVCILLGALLAGIVLQRLDFENRWNVWGLLLGVSLGLAPLFILWSVSAWTPIHMFVARHRLVAIPGVVLCWSFLLSRIDSPILRALLCSAVVAIGAVTGFTDPHSRQHGYTWKNALQFAEKNAASDHAPILICSDLPESDHERMPVENAKDSPLLIPLSYYKVSVPIVPLPRTLNQETVRVATEFLQDPGHRHQRFLAMAFATSRPTLEWLAARVSPTYKVRWLGQFDAIMIMEFTPHSD